MLHISNFSKCFGHHIIFHQTEFTCPDRGVVLLQGENGSGKSTLLNILSFMDEKYDGEYSIHGISQKKLPNREKEKKRRDEISYVMQKDNLIHYLSTKENMRLGGVEDKEARKEKVHTLSQGQQILLTLKRELVAGKKMYLLDEISSHLDPNNRKKVHDFVQANVDKALFVISCHDDTFLDIADVRYQIQEKKLVCIQRKERQEKEIPQESSPHDRKVPLFLKRTRSVFPVHLFSFFIFSFVFLLGWVGMLATGNDSKPYLKDAFKDQEYVVIPPSSEVDTEKLLTEFPSSHLQCQEMVVYSENVDDDGKVHVSQRTVLYYDKHFRKDGTFQYFSVSMPYQLDEDVPFGLAYLYGRKEELLSNRKSEECPYLLDFKNNYWPVGERSGYASFSTMPVYSQILLLNSKSMMSLLGKESPFDLQDDVFYVNAPAFESEGRVHFEFSPSLYRNEKAVDYNVIFPDGVAVKSLSLPGVDANVLHYIYVSDATMNKILPYFPPKRSVVTKIEDRDRLFSFIDRNFLKAGYVSSGYHSSSLSHYHQSIQEKTFLPGVISYSIMESVSFLLLLLFVGLFAWFIYNVQKKNDRILRLKGISHARMFFMDVFPFLLSLSLSAVSGYFLMRLASYSHPYLLLDGFHTAMFLLVSFLAIFLLLSLFFVFWRKVRCH